MDEQTTCIKIQDYKDAIDQYKAALERFEAIELRIREIASKMIPWSRFSSMENVVITFDDDDFDDGDWVHVSWTEWSHGSDDYHDVDFPISYIWDDDWHEKHLAVKAREAQLAEVEKARREAEKARKAEERRRAQYLKLKEEFENAPPKQD